MTDQSYKPDYTHHILPYVYINGVPEFLEFAQNVLNAKINTSADDETGNTFFAMIQIQETVVYVQEPMGDENATTSSLYLYVADTDAAYQNALDHGAKSMTKPEDQLFGDRNASVLDKWGNRWWFATYLD